MHPVWPHATRSWEGSVPLEPSTGSSSFGANFVAGARLGVGREVEKLPVSMELGISGGIGLLFGSLLAWLALRSRTAALQARLSLTEKELAAAKADLARLLEDQRDAGGEPGAVGIGSGIGTKDQQRKDRIADQSRGSRRRRLAECVQGAGCRCAEEQQFFVPADRAGDAEAISERGPGRSRRAAESGRRSGHAGARVAEQGGRADSADGNCARRGVWRSEGAGSIPDHHAKRIAIGDWESGAGACALRMCAGAGEKSNCGGWSRLRACCPIAILPNRKQ